MNSLDTMPQDQLHAVEAVPSPGREPINILIVDDEPKNLTVLETILDSPDYRLVRAESADQALLALVVEDFALLILDIRMPAMTGFELAQMIRNRKRTAQIPIIFLTAYYTDDQHVLEGYSAGAVDYIHKPVNAAVLRSKVGIFAELHRKSREAAVANRALLAEVAQRRRAEEQLRQLNESLERKVTERTADLLEHQVRLRLTADAARLTYVAIDFQRGRALFAKNYSELMGCAPLNEDLPAEDVPRVLLAPVVVSDRDRVAASIERLLRGESQGKVSFRVRDGNGQERHIESVWSIEFAADRSPLHAFITIVDTNELRRIEKLNSVLIAEVNHRARNLLAVVQSVVRHTQRSSTPAQFSSRLTDRLNGLAASHDLLASNQWQGVDLAKLAEVQMRNLVGPIGGRVRIDGPPTQLKPAAAQALGLALHEMATNALKYGALSTQNGRVDIHWQITESDRSRFVMWWSEVGGPPVQSPQREGFGQVVIGRATEAAVDGKVEVEFAPEGFRWTLDAPLDGISQEGD